MQTNRSRQRVLKLNPIDILSEHINENANFIYKHTMNACMAESKKRIRVRESTKRVSESHNAV